MLPQEPRRFPFWRWIVLSVLIGAAIYIFLGPRLSNFPLDSPEFKKAVQALQTNNEKVAVEIFDKQIKAAPTTPQTYHNIANSCILANKHDLAVRYLQKGVEACAYAPKPERAMLYVSLSNTYTYIEKVRPQTNAIEAAKQAYELSPKSAEILNQYGYLLVDNDQQIEYAIQLIIEALRIVKQEGNNPEMYSLVIDSYGWALYKLGRYDEAIVALQDAIDTFPHELIQDRTRVAMVMKELHYHLGAAYRKKKRYEEARNSLNTARSYDSSYQPAIDELESLEKEAPAEKPVGNPEDKEENPYE